MPENYEEIKSLGDCFANLHLAIRDESVQSELSHFEESIDQQESVKQNRSRKREYAELERIRLNRRKIQENNKNYHVNLKKQILQRAKR